MTAEEALARRLAAAHGRDARTLVALGEGADHRAFLLDGSLVVRLARTPDPARVRREAALLDAVAAVSPLPVPRPCWIDEAAGALAYPRLAGAPLSTLAREVGVALAPALGALLAALHGLAPDGAAIDFDGPAAWLADAATAHDAADVPPGQRAAVERFLRTPAPARAPAPAFSHNDLGAEHVLVDAGRISGVIDWGDAALCDPAYDFGLLRRDLGPAGLEAALRGYGAPPRGLAERAVFYARCAALEDLAGTAPARGRGALAHLFGG